MIKTRSQRCRQMFDTLVGRRTGIVRAAGLEMKKTPIRGGTDGARLSFMGLPTPNVFTGGHNYHSRREWVAVQHMEKSVEVVLRLLGMWAERGGKQGLLTVPA